jgi:hypothetical protein
MEEALMLLIKRFAQAALLTTVVVFGACKSDPVTTVTNDPPVGLTATATSLSATHLAWTSSSSVTGYVLQRATGATGVFAEITRPTSTATSYDDTGLTPGTQYRYRLAAIRTAGTSDFSAVATATTSAITTVDVTTNITANTTWTSDHIYKIVGFRKVASGATLTIQPGTKIIGDYNTLGSALFILRGAQIIANGTATAPIVFTSSQPDGSRLSGDWGGVLIIGNGIDNRSGVVNVEGTGTSADNNVIQYNGGTNNADNSGSLSYVRIEYAGYAPVVDNEFNSFTFCAVGSGTNLDHLESLNGLDDAFEFFGGAVSGKYLVAYEVSDDAFDMSEGYTGRLQYLVAYTSHLLTPRPLSGGNSVDPQGIENDGCNGAGCDLGFNTTPFTTPVVANFTLVGTGPGVVPTGGGYGAILRRGTGGHYINGILARWPNFAIGYRDAESKQRETDGFLSIKNLLIVETPAGIFQTGQQTTDAAANSIIWDQATTTASLFVKFPTQPATAADFDWSLSANAPARTGGLTTFTGDLATRAGTFVLGTAFRGAADPAATTKWWDGWTSYSRN